MSTVLFYDESELVQVEGSSLRNDAVSPCTASMQYAAVVHTV